MYVTIATVLIKLDRSTVDGRMNDGQTKWIDAVNGWTDRRINKMNGWMGE